ncbi:MAG: response regulator transcription factor [Planctomycetales bacterium]|nr:response regulator transcription factor [Planctomycetales bacterium]
MAQPKLFVVDNDPSYRDRVSTIARTLNLEPDPHHSAESFLTAFSPHQVGCIVSELRLYGLSGLELLDHLVEMDSWMPVIFLTAHAKTDVTVTAMRRGALSVLDKPLDEEKVWNALRLGLLESEKRRSKWQQEDGLRRRFSKLTSKEAEVAEFIVQGKTNREIATKQRVSVPTIETRRQKTYSKLGANSLPEFVELMMKYNSLHKPIIRNLPTPRPALSNLPPVEMQVPSLTTD